MYPPVSLLVAADQNAAIGLAVVVQSSLLSLHKGRSLEVNLIDCGLTSEQLYKLQRTLEKSGKKFKLNVAKPSLEQLDGVRVDEVGLFTYARLLSAELFPRLKRAVYLDTDVVVNLDLAEFFDQELMGYPIAAVQDRFTPTVSHSLSILDWKERGMNHDDPYFNAGVLLIDFESWRAESIGINAMKFARENPQLCVRWDQTALNVLLYNRWKPCEKKWNYMVFSNIEEECASLGFNFHITAKPKQWDLDPKTNNGLYEMFYNYLDQTAWKGWRPWTPESEGKLRPWIKNNFPEVANLWRALKKRPIRSRKA